MTNPIIIIYDEDSCMFLPCESNRYNSLLLEGYVYILKCDNKYKIGFSKDVDRRIKQLSGMKLV